MVILHEKGVLLMRRLKYCVVTFVLLCLLFTGSYYLSYQRALSHFNENAVQQNNDLYDQIELANAGILNEIEDESPTDQKNADSLSADAGLKSKVGQNAIFYLETYDIVNRKMVREEQSVPAEFVGLSRNEIIDYLVKYMQDIPLQDYEKGLSSYELLSFSEDELAVRKTYNQDLVPNRFYLALREGQVVVFHSDLETIYEYTQIKALDLPESDRNQLVKGFYVKDLETLYSILEGYTS